MIHVGYYTLLHAVGRVDFLGNYKETMIRFNIIMLLIPINAYIEMFKAMLYLSYI